MIFLWACAVAPLELEVDVQHTSARIVASEPVDRVELRDASGLPIVTRALPAAASEVVLQAPLRAGERVVAVAWADGRTARTTGTAPLTEPVRIEVLVPGRPARPVRAGEVIAVPSDRVEVAVTALDAVRIDGVDLAAGERRTVPHAVPGTVTVGGTSFELVRRDVPIALSVTGTALPVDATGTRDLARPADRVTLPSRWWRTWLLSGGVGYRVRDAQAPWCWHRVTVHNDGPEPVDVVVTAQVLEDDAAAHAFRPRFRDVPELDRVTALLRVPPKSEAAAVMPLFVDGAMLPHNAAFERVIEVTPLGADAPAATARVPLYVTRGNWLVGAAFLGLVGACLGGLALLALRGRRWLEEARTSELVTIALFASLTFVVGAASQLLGMGVASFLGPFAPFVTGLVDDAVRACLLGTLVVLLPRPGVATLALLTGYAMRALALGSAHPVDILYIGSNVLFLESMLWISGLTRGRADWLWARLSIGFGVAHCLGIASALLVNVVLYRLYYAGWYVAALLALPGFVYVVLGSRIAVDFAASLRKVQS